MTRGALVRLLPLLAAGAIAAGLAARAAGLPAARADLVWLAGLAVTGLPVALRTLRGMVRGDFAADVVAALAIVAALLLREPLAGLVVVLMQTGGEALEHYAQGRASAAVRALEAAAPRVAHRWRGEALEDVPADAVAVGDRLLVRPGELVPCDAVVLEGRSHVDTAALTGEPMPRPALPGAPLLSGMGNLEGALTVRATAPARESQYARIVELVRSAQASKAPMQRVADRYAVWFTPLTLGVCALVWLLSRDPARVLAVLVVATPCPLILAVPVAVIGGINRAARRQVILRHGGALERLGDVTVALFDKTGTLTLGRPSVHAVHAVAPFTADTLLRAAGALERHSGHLLAQPLVAAAEERVGALPAATAIHERAGRGLTGVVEGRRVAVGSARFVADEHPALAEAIERLEAAHSDADGGVRAVVAVDGALAGLVAYADAIRPGLHDFVHRLRALGLRRVELLSGDRAQNAELVARALGFDAVAGELLPEGKVARVRALEAAGERVVMVGDGTNDAPALSAATVGVALASGGGGITAEAADAVILADDPTRVADAITISRRTLRIARQSVWAGLGLSGAAMGVAAFGHIPPITGALLQEAIDVAVILNALRASAAGR